MACSDNSKEWFWFVSDISGRTNQSSSVHEARDQIQKFSPACIESEPCPCQNILASAVSSIGTSNISPAGAFVVVVQAMPFLERVDRVRSVSLIRPFLRMPSMEVELAKIWSTLGTENHHAFWAAFRETLFFLGFGPKDTDLYNRAWTAMRAVASTVITGK